MEEYSTADLYIRCPADQNFKAVKNLESLNLNECYSFANVIKALSDQDFRDAFGRLSFMNLERVTMDEQFLIRLLTTATSLNRLGLGGSSIFPNEGGPLLENLDLSNRLTFLSVYNTSIRIVFFERLLRCSPLIRTFIGAEDMLDYINSKKMKELSEIFGKIRHIVIKDENVSSEKLECLRASCPDAWINHASVE